MSTFLRKAAPVRTGLRGLAIALVLLVTPALAAEPTPEVDDGLDVYFRDSDLTAVAEQGWAEYLADDPGDNALLERSFIGAPPQIPHSLEDMLPIVQDDNVCLECHSPEEAEGAEAPAIPESHFSRPRIVGGPMAPAPDDGGAALVRVEDYEVSADLTGFQFNCVQCHVPQAGNVTDVVSTFVGAKAER